LHVLTQSGFSPCCSLPLQTSQTLLGNGTSCGYTVPKGQAIVQLPQPVQSIFERFNVPASLLAVFIFSSASRGQAFMHGAPSHRLHINAKRIISSSESNPLLSG
jgi:hypothetical protein